MAVLVPLDHYRSWLQESQEVFAMVDEVRQQSKDYPEHEMIALIDEAVNASKKNEISGRK